MRTAIREAIERECKSAQDIADAAIKEGRAELKPEELDKIDGHMKKADELKTAGLKEAKLFGKMKAFTDDLGLGGDDDDDDKVRAQKKAVADAKAITPEAAARRLSIGERFVKSDEYRGLLKSVPNGLFSDKMRVQSAVHSYKALLTGADHDTSAGSLLRTDYRGLLDPYYKRPLTLRDVVGKGSTTTDTIEYVRLVSVTNNAAPVAEASTADAIDGTMVDNVMGGLKPESAMAFEKDQTTVKTIAHWIPATKRALADAGQIRTLIDEFLRYGLEEELEDQMLTGTGVGENFLGLSHVSGTQTQTAGAGQDIFDVTRMARRKVRIGGRAVPTAYVMNPIDWERIELERNGNGDFYAGGPFAMATPRLWGLPVVESEVIPQGTAWVGAWNYAVLYDREQAGIQVTDTHSDFFIRNLVAILAEMRAAFAVLRPPAFVKITLPA